MAMLGDLITEPEKVVFIAPFTENKNTPLQITNDGCRQIGWAIKTNCPARISADPPCGVLGPKEIVSLSVNCEPFDYESTDVSTDRIAFVWVLTPDGAGKAFNREWFQGNVIMRRKNIEIEYNMRGNQAMYTKPKIAEPVEGKQEGDNGTGTDKERKSEIEKSEGEDGEEIFI